VFRRSPKKGRSAGTARNLQSLRGGPLLRKEKSTELLKLELKTREGGDGEKKRLIGQCSTGVNLREVETTTILSEAQEEYGREMRSSPKTAVARGRISQEGQARPRGR